MPDLKASGVSITSAKRFTNFQFSIFSIDNYIFTRYFNCVFVFITNRLYDKIVQAFH